MKAAWGVMEEEVLSGIWTGKQRRGESKGEITNSEVL